MSDWKSIEEGGPPAADGPPVILRGVLATEPASYKRIYGQKKLTTLGVIILALQRVIAWSFAGIVHLAAAAMLMTVYLEIAQPDDSVLFAKLWRENQPVESEKNEEDTPTPAEADVSPSMPEKRPEDDVKPPPLKMAKPLPLPPVPTPVPQPPKPDVAPSPDPIPAPAVDPKPKPATIGGGASAGGGAPARGDIDGSDISTDPGAAVGKRRAGDLGHLRGGSAEEIVVVKGVYDKIEKVLEKLGIPHRLVEADDFPRANLSKARALLINCHQTYPSKNTTGTSTASMERKIQSLERAVAALERRVKQTRDRRTVARLKFDLLSATSELESLRRTLARTTAMEEVREKVAAFVADGGYVFTSDWGLSILEQAFPGWVKNGGSVGPKTVTIEAPRRIKSKEMLEEVFYDPDRKGGGNTVSEKKFAWKIDTNSFLIDRRKTAIEVLVDCREIKKHGAVAVVFSPKGAGGGKVLHILSHFQNQATQHGDYALQNLLLNFLLDRVRRGKK